MRIFVSNNYTFIGGSRYSPKRKRIDCIFKPSSHPAFLQDYGRALLISCITGESSRSWLLLRIMQQVRVHMSSFGCFANSCRTHRKAETAEPNSCAGFFGYWPKSWREMRAGPQMGGSALPTDRRIAESRRKERYESDWHRPAHRRMRYNRTNSIKPLRTLEYR